MAAVTLLNNAQADGPGQALDCRNGKFACLVVTGNFEAAVNFEFSLDGVNFYPLTGCLNGGLESSVTYSPGYAMFNVEPFAYIRPRVSAYKSGSVTVVGYVEAKPDEVFTYAHFNATTTGTLIKSGPGVLHSVSIGDAGSGMAVTLYDNTSATGTVIGVYKVAGSFILDVAFQTGLFITISATTAGDVTVAYK